MGVIPLTIKICSLNTCTIKWFYKSIVFLWCCQFAPQIIRSHSFVARAQVAKCQPVLMSSFMLAFWHQHSWLVFDQVMACCLSHYLNQYSFIMTYILCNNFSSITYCNIFSVHKFCSIFKTVYIKMHFISPAQCWPFDLGLNISMTFSVWCKLSFFITEYLPVRIKILWNFIHHNIWVNSLIVW